MSTFNVIVIGARTARQGIGEFVAARFAECGARVAAVVGTSVASVERARATLRERYGLDCRGYTDLPAALAAESTEIVAICSPYAVHAEHLVAVGRASRHCLCEKPMIDPRADTDIDALIAPFVRSGRHLAVLTQWPCTLPPFFDLYPEQAGRAVEQFEMRLSPISTGADMAPDAVPHFLSMLRALAGNVSIDQIDVTFTDGDPRRLRITTDVAHPKGRMKAILNLQTCPNRPRPAWYAINGDRADREIEQPGYRQYLRAATGRRPLQDPLCLLVRDFLADVAANRPTDADALAHDQRLLTLVCGAVRAHGPSNP